MSLDRRFNGLLATLYTAPISPELWPEFLDKLANLLDLNGSAIVHTDLTRKANGIYTSRGIDPEIERLYAAGYGNQDVYRARFLQLHGRQGELLMGDELCSFRQIKKTAFGEDILHRADIRLWCAVATVRTNTVIENISLYHGWDHHPPGPDKLTLARQIAPHLNNALRVRAKLVQLEGLSRDLAAAIDSADTAIVLLDCLGCCALVNRAAKRILDRREGLIFAGNRLAATDPHESAGLSELIRKSVASERGKEAAGSETIRISRQHGKPLHLRIAPFPCERLFAGSQFSAIVFIGNPDRSASLPLEILERSYGLTPAEAKLAMALFEGRRMAEIATTHHVTKETVRSQLKSVFLKTETRRQAELVSLLASFPTSLT
jgi:DNA-binding CsgD family transcriptional regulator